MEKEILFIQVEESGGFSWYVPELAESGKADSTNKALEAAFECIVKGSESLGDKTGKIAEKIAALRHTISDAEAEIEHLKAEMEAVSNTDSSLGAYEILDERERCERAVHILNIDHPLEAVWGEVKCVAFFPYRDVNKDGKIDCAKVLYNTKRF